MLLELAVRDLGVIEELGLVVGPGLTALTGETGAGKTLVVHALDLLLGGRADPMLVRPGAEEARVEGRFELDGEEVVLSRVVAREGRSRAYVDGRMATAAALGDLGRRLVDLHGQHASQSLLAAATQRAALDRAGGIDLGPLRVARSELTEVEAALAALGGDARARARELDLLRHQLAELEAAGLDDPDEEVRLEAEEDRLADAGAHREAAAAAVAALTEDGGALDAIGSARRSVAGRGPFAELEVRLKAAGAELADAAADLRALGEAIEDDPERLAAIGERRRVLRSLRRRYGETLADVIAYGGEAARRAAELEGHDDRLADLEARRDGLRVSTAREAARVGAARRAAAPRLAAEVQRHLRDLGLPKARLEVDVEGDDGDGVTFRLGANPGEPALPLARVASGGELSRAMLALRLVLTDAPPTLVFDEVDAGLGGRAALAVGRALGGLALAGHQVLVVTHLAQVAAFADAQVVVEKGEARGRTVSRVRPLGGDDRVVELSRMLSGLPDSDSGRRHAEELLEAAATARSGR